jgi:hypothetical protein
LGAWWSDIAGQHIAFTERDIMLGLVSRPGKVKMELQLNSIIMAVKWRLHADKQMGQSTSFYQVLFQVKRTIDTLTLIAAKNQTTAKNDKLWENISRSLR